MIITRAMAVCVTVMVGRASAIIGINVIKLLLDYNCEAVFYIFGTIALGMSINIFDIIYHHKL